MKWTGFGAVRAAAATLPHIPDVHYLKEHYVAYPGVLVRPSRDDDTATPRQTDRNPIVNGRFTAITER